ncbi:hypothetical protein Peur_020356 [Populus x canadensis]
MGYVREKQRTAFFKRRRRQPKERKTMVGTWKDWDGRRYGGKASTKDRSKRLCHVRGVNSVVQGSLLLQAFDTIITFTEQSRLNSGITTRRSRAQPRYIRNLQALRRANFRDSFKTVRQAKLTRGKLL